ncbi:MAG: cytochrome c biogenesis protein CcsA [Verrucomicrobiae bacterium]|nr:cytochrome c biogenesis protein CcsA [Verrucomicrobiae bacterium]
MPLLTDRMWFQAAVIVYGIGLVYSVFLWRRGFRRDDRIHYLILLVAYALHLLAMMKRGYSLQRCPTSNLYEATVFIGWAMMSACLGLALVQRFRFLPVFANPVMVGLGVFAMMPGLDTPSTATSYTGVMVSLHAAFTLLAYGSFGLAAAAGVMYLTQERDLKMHRTRILFSLLPPITRLEKVVTWLTVAGLGLLSAGLVVGFAGIPPPPGVHYYQDFKVVWSCVVWGVYAALLLLHWRFATRGRRFAWGAVGAFAFVLLTYWGSNLASPLHQP